MNFYVNSMVIITKFRPMTLILKNSLVSIKWVHVSTHTESSPGQQKFTTVKQCTHYPDKNMYNSAHIIQMKT
jgi:hypothetical protein